MYRLGSNTQRKTATSSTICQNNAYKKVTPSQPRSMWRTIFLDLRRNKAMFVNSILMPLRIADCFIIILQMRRQTYSPELNQDIYTSNRKQPPTSPKVDSMYQTTNIVFDKLKSDTGLRPHHKGKLITNSVIVSTEKDTSKMSGSQNEISDALLARRILQQSVPIA